MTLFVDLGGNGKGASLSPRKLALKKRHLGTGNSGLPVGTPTPPPIPPVTTTYYYAPLLTGGI
jgi:hypothetical protein